MAKAASRKKNPVAAMIEFSRSRDIPFNRIRLSDSNVRETDVGAGLDELTHDIDRREDLVQGLNVRAILDEDGNPPATRRILVVDSLAAAAGGAAGLEGSPAHAASSRHRQARAGRKGMTASRDRAGNGRLYTATGAGLSCRDHALPWATVS